MILVTILIVVLLFTSCSKAEDVKVDTSDIVVRNIYYGEYNPYDETEKTFVFRIIVDNNTEHDLVSINFAKPSEDYSFLEASYYTVSANSSISSTLQSYSTYNDVDEQTVFEQLQKEDFSITFTINGKRYFKNGEWENHAGEDPIP